MSPPRGSVPLALVLALMTGGLALAVDPAPKAMSLLRKALQESSAGNYGAALKLYFDAHKEDPEILALDDEGLLNKSARWLSDQLDDDDSDVHAHFQMAELKSLQGMERQALGHFEKVVSLAPDSPLAKLAKPLIQDLQATVAALPNPAASSGGGGGGGGGAAGGSSSKISELEDQVTTLRDDLARARNEVQTLKQRLAKAQAGGDARGELDKLRKEFNAYKAEAEQWKLYKNLYFANPANVRDLRRLSGS